ncbi:MAG: DUF4282 domain-containing protein [Azoarcus sp.]|jgi:hypothetical protein|nr:DUF4282 domain-containing protein [Azoarcus sp.]
MKELLSFDTMYTPKIIAILFILGLVGMLVAGITMIVSGGVLQGLGIIVFGAIGVRVYCELMAVAFKINEALQELRKK